MTPKEARRHEALQFALLGLGLGALYSLASQGLMVIYRGSGVLNFAHGAIGMVGAYVEWEVYDGPAGATAPARRANPSGWRGRPGSSSPR